MRAKRDAPVTQPLNACSRPPSDSAGSRAGSLRMGLRLEYLTVGWNVIGGLVASAAAIGAGSVALLGFGLDSFVEAASAGILVWRLRKESHSASPDEMERLDRRARRLVGVSLYVLAAFILLDAARALWIRERPEPSRIGIAITALSIGVIAWLSRAKRRVAVALGSRALESDAFQTSACWWLSVITLAGVLLNAVTGWWWADPAAAIGMTPMLFREAREAWHGEECCA